MRRTVQAVINNHLEIRKAASFTELAEIADEWNARGIKPVHFLRDGVRQVDPDELDRLIEEEERAADPA